MKEYIRISGVIELRFLIDEHLFMKKGLSAQFMQKMPCMCRKKWDKICFVCREIGTIAQM
jgi:hypothetical protein